MHRDDLRFTVDVAAAGDGSVVTPRGELDVATQGALREVLERETARRPVTLDLSALRFIDTSGMRLVLETAEAARRNGSGFTVLPGSPAVQRLFDVAGVAELVPFRNAEEGGAS